MLFSITDFLMFYLADYEYIVSEDDWIIHNHKEYFVSNERMPMQKAREFCRRNGGDLAVIENESERKFLWKYVRHMFYFKHAPFCLALRHLLQLACEILESDPLHKNNHCHLS